MREQVVDFSLPYFTEGYAIVSAAPIIVGRSLSILRPFTFPVWMIFIACIILIGPLVFFMDNIGSKYQFHSRFRTVSAFRRHLDGEVERVKTLSKDLNGEEKSWRNQLNQQNRVEMKLEGIRPIQMLPLYSLNLFRTIVVQGNFIFTTVDSVRLIMAFWYIFSLVMTCECCFINS